MRLFLTRRYPAIIVVFAALLFAKMQMNKRGSGAGVCYNISGDARGYYAWLPATFIYHDLHCHFFDTVELVAAPCAGMPIQDYRVSIKGQVINKYFPGSSFAMLPFFAGAHAIASLTGHPANGYSPPYFVAVGVAGVAANAVGMLYILAILATLGIPRWQQALCVVVLTAGTNLMYYTIDAPAYSHIYSFALVAALLYYCLQLRLQYRAAYVAVAALLAGWIVVARPVNITVLLVPAAMLWPHRQALVTWLKRPAHTVLLLPLILMPTILLALYYTATGSAFVYSYGKEGFNFLHPHLWQYLTSYNNGVLPYTPLLICLPVSALVYRGTERRLLLAALVAIVLSIYIHASWWDWTYGVGFGPRTLADLVPLYAIVLGITLLRTRERAYTLLLPALLLCTLLTGWLYAQKSGRGYMTRYPVTDYWQAVLPDNQ